MERFGPKDAKCKVETASFQDLLHCRVTIVLHISVAKGVGLKCLYRLRAASLTSTHFKPQKNFKRLV